VSGADQRFGEEGALLLVEGAIKMSDRNEQPTGARLLPLSDLTLTGPGHHVAVVRDAWNAVSARVATRLGLILPEPAWVDDSECAVYSRQMRLAKIQLNSDSVEDIATVVVRHGAQLLSLADTARLLVGLRERAPIYGREMDRLEIPTVFVHGLLRHLLKEQVSIQDIETILSVVIEGWKPGCTVDSLLEPVREALAGWLCQTYGGAGQELTALILTPRLESTLKSKLASGRHVFNIDPDGDGRRFLEHLHSLLVELGEKGLVLLCAPEIRLALWRLIGRSFRQLPVLSWNEVTDDYDVQVAATVEFKL
jgi:type III secretory pathway component EscV